MLTGLGMVGYSPRPGDPFLMNLSNVMTCSMLTDTVEVYGTIVAGENSCCLSVLGTAEIDQYGNINTVRIGGSLFIGVGGAGDAVNAAETVVITKQARSRLLEKVSYVGCSGERIRTLVTDLGVYKKAVGEEIFTLKKVLVDEALMTVEKRIVEIREKCGWDLKLSPSLEEISAPNQMELDCIRALDPDGVFTGKDSKMHKK
jgi:acyl CoA:acetate/3-ketoacid CoA transferase beta subunit